jgi:hypothetical protein
MRAIIVAFLSIVWPCSMLGQTKGLETGTVKIVAVREIQAREKASRLQVEISYAYPGVPTIYIDGFGETSGSGTLSYITDEPNLVIRQKHDGEKVFEHKLAPTGIAMGVEGDSHPDFKHYGGAAQGLISAKFPGAADQLLIDQFQLAPYVYIHNQTTYVETRYHRVDTNDQNLIVEVAVQIAYPSELSKSETGFEVKYAVRERRKATDWQDSMSTAADSASTSFVAALTGELRKAM